MAEPVDAPAARVALVLVSHSALLAGGLAELAAQMAPGVRLLAAGGRDDGGLGTSFTLVGGAVRQAAEDSAGVLLLADLGSAVLTAESVLDLLEPEVADRVRLADAPFVEGTVAAAVAAHAGVPLDGVLAAAEFAGGSFPGRPADGGEVGPAPAGRRDGDPDDAAGREPGPSEDGELVRTVVLRNPLGLHARPASVLARLVAGFDAAVTVQGVNATSVLELMRLGAVGGQTLEVRASGVQATTALEAVVAAVEGGFGEV